ncbi:hypothetical protein BC628DRAFT_1415712 [Trametes gibbosa]|nr:hypothetical protein BC628DRAFT_1415712 [Trametes gibbosa]
MASRLDFALRDLPAPPRHTAPYLPPPPYAPSPSHHPFSWHSQAHHSALFAGPLAPSSWTNAGPSIPTSLWPAGPPDFLLPFHRYPTKPYDTSAGFALALARSDTSSATSRDSDLSPSPEVAEVVCNAPLVAPVPLPYHSPTFLMYDLPDEDEDLSHPPYTHRPHKRKRTREESESEDASECEPDARRDLLQPAKRRALGATPRRDADSQWEWTCTASGTAAAAAATAGGATGMATLRHAAPAAAGGFSRRHRAR